MRVNTTKLKENLEPFFNYSLTYGVENVSVSLEKLIYLRAYELTQNQTEVAKMLKINRSTLAMRMKRIGLTFNRDKKVLMLKRKRKVLKELK